MTATNKDLEQLVKDGRFREDLCYRINVINLDLPPLPERYDDIEALSQFLIEKLALRYGGRKIWLMPEALECLSAYDWPGNVRELENVIESLMALASQDLVSAQDLPVKIRNRDEHSKAVPPVLSSGLAFEQAERMFETEVIVKALKRANFVQTEAAEFLGISRRILKYKMDKLKINERGEVLTASAEQPVVAEVLPGSSE